MPWSVTRMSGRLPRGDPVGKVGMLEIFGMLHRCPSCERFHSVPSPSIAMRFDCREPADS